MWSCDRTAPIGRRRTTGRCLSRHTVCYATYRAPQVQSKIYICQIFFEADTNRIATLASKSHFRMNSSPQKDWGKIFLWEPVPGGEVKGTRYPEMWYYIFNLEKLVDTLYASTRQPVHITSLVN